MSHTTSTPNYSLPQFRSDDTPAWRDDINPAFSAIDTAMKQISDDSTVRQNEVVNLTTRVTNDEKTIADHTTAIAELHEGVDTLETELGNIGTATETNAGLVKISDKFPQSGGGSDFVASSDTAMSTKAGAELIKYADNTAGARAPIYHANVDGKYGVGSDAVYGHVKLTDSYTESTTGAALSSAGAVAMYNDISGKTYAPVNHASTATTYGKADAANYGHVKLVDTVTANNGVAQGVGISPKGVHNGMTAHTSTSDFTNGTIGSTAIHAFGHVTKNAFNMYSFNMIIFLDVPSGGIPKNTVLATVKDTNIRPTNNLWITVPYFADDANGVKLQTYDEIYMDSKGQIIFSNTFTPSTEIVGHRMIIYVNAVVFDA